jgi:hypothetical protein
VGLLSFVTLIAFTGTSAEAATAIDLGAATSYAVIGGQGISNTGSSVITGNVANDPLGLTSITGFGPGIINGSTDAADAQSLLVQNADTAAYLVAAAAPSTTTVSADLGGTTLPPGVYTEATPMSLTGTVTLDGGGDPNAVFIFQTGATLTTAPGSSVLLEGDAQACNVFWQVGSSATLGTTTSFVGTILALTSDTLNTGATVDGRIFAQTGAVTLNDNDITVPTCTVPPTTTTTTPLPTTTSSILRYPPPTVTTTTEPPTTTTSPPPVVTTTLPPTTPTAVVVTTTTSPPLPPEPPAVIKAKAITIPIGAPATGEGGMAGSGHSPLGLIGIAALSVGLGAASVALRLRRRNG